MDFTNEQQATDVVNLTQNPGSEGLPPVGAAAGQQANPPVRQYIAYTPQEQLNYATQGYVPVNTQLRPDPNNALQMREFVYPGTWDNFNNIRYAGANNEAVLEWQLARAYGLHILVPQGDPQVRQFLRDHFRVEEIQQQQMQCGGLHQQQAMPPVGAPATLSAIQTTISAAPAAEGASQQLRPQPRQNPTVAPASSTLDSGMPIMADPPASRPDWLGRSHLSRFVKRFNEKRGGRVEEARK